MLEPILKPIIPDDLKGTISVPEDLVRQFVGIFEPSESADVLHLFVDARTLALYCECHVRGSKLVPLSTTDVPLDPEEQPEYRANREVVADHIAFSSMKEDALKRRSFSNIVAEFTTEFDEETPLKIIGGQHRFESIKEALNAGIDELHGIKVYFGLTSEQRLDAQLISNTVIAVPTDLYDRMQETMHGPHLRDWCQKVGLLDEEQDFSEKRQRGGQITVNAARTFILNYYLGQKIDLAAFEKSETSPIIPKSGSNDTDWIRLRAQGKLWNDAKLETAGREFADLIKAQRLASEGNKKASVDTREKALNYAILASWAYIAGLLSTNPTRLRRHYDLKNQAGRDPLNAAALAKGRHATDADNYRGLGYRTDAKERGRLVELFYLQAEQGKGISSAFIDLAIKKYHAKQAILEVQNAEKKVA
jgi:hypothetical protein